MAKKKKAKLQVNPEKRVDWAALITAIVLSLACLIAITDQFYKGSNVTSDTSTASDIKKVIQPNALFYTQVFLSRQKTFITYPFKFDQPPQTMWLSLQSQVGQPTIKRLVMHPLLYSLSWKRIESNTLSLYQRNRSYSSIESFLNQPPSMSKVMIDESIPSLVTINVEKATVLENEISNIPDSIDYIVTSYKPPIEKEGWYHFEATINADNAQLNANNELAWHVYVPKASETNPFYLGAIHIDYRQ